MKSLRESGIVSAAKADLPELNSLSKTGYAGKSAIATGKRRNVTLVLVFSFPGQDISTPLPFLG
jgi:hypothetical protein